MSPPRLPVRERFEARVQRVECGCLLWTAGKATQGYGRLCVDGKTLYAHHVAWFLEYGFWPEFLQHECDTPACVEIKHLVEGTPASNMADRDAKGRQTKGEKHPRAKLSDDDVFDIRWLHGLGASYRGIAKEYDVTYGLIGHIIRGELRL